MALTALRTAEELAASRSAALQQARGELEAARGELEVVTDERDRLGVAVGKLEAQVEERDGALEKLSGKLGAAQALIRHEPPPAERQVVKGQEPPAARQRPR